MKHPWILSLLVLVSSALALDYPQALQRAEERPPVATARLQLQDARDQLARTESDPLALKLDRLKARQAVGLAEAQLRLARIQAQAEISAAYTQVLDAEAQRELAREALAVAEKALAITRLRYEKGGATSQELTQAELGLADAQNRLKQAEEGAVLARSRLASLLDRFAEDEPLASAPELAVPTWKEVEAALAQHPDALRARQGVELARAARELLDPSYAPLAQIESAELAIKRAQNGLREAERGLRLRAEARWQELDAKRRALELSERKLAQAEEDLTIARARYEAGLVSEFALMQVGLKATQARVERDVAYHAYLGAAWSLAESVALPLEVVHAQ